MGMVRANVARRLAEAEPAGIALDRTIDEAAAWLTARQADDGHWVFELEADATIPSDYIMLNHFLDEIDDPVEQKLATYLRRRQGKHGGWSLFYDGDVDLSASVRAYFALKLVGDHPDAPHMRGRAKRFSPAAAPPRPTSSPASIWCCSDRCRGGRCR